MVGLVDEWAARFFEELDYVNEGENGMLFSEMMRKDLPQVIFLIFSFVTSDILFSFEAAELVITKIIKVKIHFSTN